MATYKTPKATAFRMPKVPAVKLPKPPVIKGPPVAKFRAAPTQKNPTLPSLTVQARRGLTPKMQLAKAAGGSNSSSKRNPDYPTP